eukprot:2695189-Pleurochrysis_carterae.AAC.1
MRRSRRLAQRTRCRRLTRAVCRQRSGCGRRRSWRRTSSVSGGSLAVPMLAATMAASAVLGCPVFFKSVRPLLTFRVTTLTTGLVVLILVRAFALCQKCAARFARVVDSVFASVQFRKDVAMAVSVGARRPVADVKAIFTSSRVPTFSPMRRMTLDSFSAMTPSDRR